MSPELLLWLCMTSLLWGTKLPGLLLPEKKSRTTFLMSNGPSKAWATTTSRVEVWKYLESFEILRMDKIRWNDKVTNEEVPQRVYEERTILDAIYYQEES